MEVLRNGRDTGKNLQLEKGGMVRVASNRATRRVRPCLYLTSSSAPSLARRRSVHTANRLLERTPLGGPKRVNKRVSCRRNSVFYSAIYPKFVRSRRQLPTVETHTVHTVHPRLPHILSYRILRCFGMGLCTGLIQTTLIHFLEDRIG